MATIKYKCNVCNRTIQKIENTKGITVFAKCIITDGCLGRLNKLDRNIDNIRENFPTAVSGLFDYSPRKALFSHTQEIKSKTWIIKHNLSSSPAVLVYIVNDTNDLIQLEQDQFILKIIDENVISLEFNTPVKGTVQCIARTVNNKPKLKIKKSKDIRITTNGIITLAVPSIIINKDIFSQNINLENTVFQLEILIKKPSEIEIPTIENINFAIDSRSPWSDYKKILVKNRKNYLIRTKSIFNLLAFGTNAVKTDIPNGTRFKFTRIMYPILGINQIESRELFFLLSTSPFALIDKTRNKIIDVGEMINTDLDYFTYKDGELFVDESVIENTYPDIKKA